MQETAAQRLPRLLLADVVVSGRHATTHAFPFIQGFASYCGVSVRWVRFVLSSADVAPGAAFTLSREDIASCVFAAEQHEATHMLLAGVSETGTLRTLRDELRGAAVATLATEGSATDLVPRGLADVQVIEPSVGSLLSWLRHEFWYPRGSHGESESLLDFHLPDYKFEPVSNRVDADRLTAHLVLGSGESRPDPDCAVGSSCLFCCPESVLQEGASFPSKDAVAQLRRQLSAIASTHPPDPSGRLWVAASVDAGPFDDLIHALAGLPMPPLAFVVALRPHCVVRDFAALRSCVETLAAHGHGLHIVRFAWQSAAPRQLSRYGADHGPAAGLRALRLIRELEADFPNTVFFTAHRGIEVQVFDEHVSPAEVGLNLAVARHARLEEACASLAVSPRIDARGATEVSDAVAHGSGASGTATKPLVFSDPRLPGLHDIVRSLLGPSRRTDDPRVTRLMRHLDETGDSALELALRACHVAAEAPRPLDADALLDALIVDERSLNAAETKPLGAEQVSHGETLDEMLALGESAADLRRIAAQAGYPDCCAEAYRERLAADVSQHTAWSFVARRLASPGSVSPMMSPALTQHVPCSLDCERTLPEVSARVARESSFGSTDGVGLTLVFLDGSAGIALLETTGDLETVAIERQEVPSYRIAYERVLAWRVPAGIRERLEGADTVEIEPGCVRLLRGAAHLGFLAMRVFPWWPGTSLHTDFWAESLRLVRGSISVRSPEGKGQASEPAAWRRSDDEEQHHSELASQLGQLVEDVWGRIAERRPSLLEGYSLGGVTTGEGPAPWGEIAVVATREGRRLTLLLKDVDADHAFRRTSRFAISHSPESEIGAPEKRLMKLLVKAIERVVPQHFLAP